jgi:hypothetical protein
MPASITPFLHRGNGAQGQLGWLSMM